MAEILKLTELELDVCQQCIDMLGDPAKQRVFSVLLAAYKEASETVATEIKELKTPDCYWDDDHTDRDAECDPAELITESHAGAIIVLLSSHSLPAEFLLVTRECTERDDGDYETFSTRKEAEAAKADLETTEKEGK